MKIEKIEIENYRNLDGIEVNFHPVLNFIVGENNLGKSNLLDCLQTALNGRGFSEKDFAVEEQPVRVYITLKLSEEEKGAFSDYFDPEDGTKINLIIEQEQPEENIKIIHQETEEVISPTLRRNVNYVKYHSLRTPREELSFDKGKGVGKFLNYLIKDYIENQQEEGSGYVNEEEINKLVNFINETLLKINVFDKFGIKAGMEDELHHLLYKMLVLKENDYLDISYIGHGIQFSAMISLVILTNLITVKEYKREPYPLFDKEDSDEKSVSMVLGLDEPEIHLHPYMQREMIKFLAGVLEGDEADFLELIKELFGINCINGQAIIVTHSPSILLNDISQVIRISKDEDDEGNDKINVASGQKVNISQNSIKHFERNMPYLKEAFFSRGAILVEGDSELGAIPKFAEKLDVDLDKYGVSVIKGDGDRSVPILAKILEQFNITYYGIVDYDCGDKEIDDTNILKTDYRDFEEELVEKVLPENEDVLFRILEEYDNQGVNRTFQSSALNKCNKKYKVIDGEIESNYSFTDELDEAMKKLIFLSWLNVNKGVVFARVIGELISESHISDKYRELIYLIKSD